MDNNNFAALMERYEMGLAYKAITALMGPSPQLLAFVNYDKVTEDSVGLESFNIVDQHEAVLAEIDNDPSLKLAVESLADTLHKTGRYLQAGGVILAGTSVAGALATGGASITLGGIALAMVTAGKIMEKVGASESAVITHDTFHNLTKLFDEQKLYDIQFVQAIPKTFGVEEWKKFHDTCRDKNFIEKFFRKSYNLDKPKSKVALVEKPFVDAGWNAGNVAVAARWLESNARATEESKKAYANRIEAVEKWVNSDNGTDKENREVLKYISKTVGMSIRPFSGSDEILTHVKGILDQVARRFQEKK